MKIGRNMMKKMWLYTFTLFVVFAIHNSVAEPVQINISTDGTPSLTQPPKSLVSDGRVSLVAHPRLLVTEESLPALRKKLAHPVYAEDMKALAKSSSPNNLAFRYLVFGDEKAGLKAKQALLKGKVPRMGGLESAITKVQFALLYDWLYPMLTPEERTMAVARISKIFKLGQKREKKKKKEPKRGDGLNHYYFNDLWGRGSAFNTLLALALADDLQWADTVVKRAASGSHRAFSPYLGGAVDVLNSMSLDSGGGHQAGIKNGPGTGYESMFMIGAGLFMHGWASATGDKLLEKTNYFEKLPYYLAYGYHNYLPIGDAGRQVLEYSTGSSSPEASSLAAWLLETEGRAKYALLFRVILGDLTKNPAKSPEQLNLPLATYLNGADLVVSKTGWGASDISVFMFARHWDTSRYEPDSGLLSIYKGNTPILVRGIAGKQPYNFSNNSGLWIWSDKKLRKTVGQGSTYWNKLNNFPKSTLRALSAEAVFDPANNEYRPETLKKFTVGVGGTFAEVEYSSLLKQKGIKEARRQIIHKGNNIEVSDIIRAPKSVNVAVSFRLAEVPEIDGARIKLRDATITILSPGMSANWVGGVGSELIGPVGAWHGNKKHGYVPGYGKDVGRARRYGLGNLFINPEKKSDAYEFKFKIEVH